MANEKRLIDANALITTIQGTVSEVARTAAYDPEWFTRLAQRQFEILGIIDEAKTVDAVEVVHGEWEIIEDDYFDLVELKCSACGASYGFEDYEDDTPKNYHYCPNCGAKMDGDGNA